jgi:hypothetical protein
LELIAIGSAACHPFYCDMYIIQAESKVKYSKIKFIKTLAKDVAEINDTPYCTTFSYWQKRISTTLQRYNAKALQQSQYKIARVTGLLHEDHNDLNNSILNDRHIYDVVV